jgi:hypothetical protein
MPLSSSNSRFLRPCVACLRPRPYRWPPPPPPPPPRHPRRRRPSTHCRSRRARRRPIARHRPALRRCAASADVATSGLNVTLSARCMRSTHSHIRRCRRRGCVRRLPRRTRTDRCTDALVTTMLNKQNQSRRYPPASAADDRRPYLSDTKLSKTQTIPIVFVSDTPSNRFLRWMYVDDTVESNAVSTTPN